MGRKYDEIGEETNKVVEKVLIEQFHIKETIAKLAPTTKPPKETKTEEEENVDQLFSTIHQPNFYVDNIPISLDTLQDVEDLFRDKTKVAHKDVQYKEAQVEDRPVEKESKETKEKTSHKEIEEERHDGKIVSST
jgi:hypothetical protein